MSAPRWPAAECIHEHTKDETRITNGVGKTIRIVPEWCLDCRARRDPNTGEWRAR